MEMLTHKSSCLPLGDQENLYRKGLLAAMGSGRPPHNDTCRPMDGWAEMDVCMDELIDKMDMEMGCMDGWIDGCMDRWMDR